MLTENWVLGRNLCLVSIRFRITVLVSAAWTDDEMYFRLIPGIRSAGRRPFLTAAIAQLSVRLCSWWWRSVTVNQPQTALMNICLVLIQRISKGPFVPFWTTLIHSTRIHKPEARKGTKERQKARKLRIINERHHTSERNRENVTLWMFVRYHSTF